MMCRNDHAEMLGQQPQQNFGQIFYISSSWSLCLNINIFPFKLRRHLPRERAGQVCRDVLRHQRGAHHVSAPAHHRQQL